MPRVAVLDDYQGVALEMANWNTLPSDCQVQVFRDHLTDLAARRSTPRPKRVADPLGCTPHRGAVNRHATGR